MTSRVPVQTKFGVLRGRDCIFLDRVGFEQGTNTVVLEGEVNGALVSRGGGDHYIGYVLRFCGVLALRMVELDSWDENPSSSLDEIVGSPWVSDLGGKVTAQHRHFCVHTYDDVFDVVCETYELEFGMERPRPPPVGVR